MAQKTQRSRVLPPTLCQRVARIFAHSTEFSGGTCHCSSKASRGKDLEVEEPVACGDFASFHFHATLAGLQGPTLIRDEVVQVGEPGEKRLVASTRMMEPLHREELALDGVMGLV